MRLPTCLPPPESARRKRVVDARGWPVHDDSVLELLDNLQDLGLEHDWLVSEIRKRGLLDRSEVGTLLCASDGGLGAMGGHAMHAMHGHAMHNATPRPPPRSR